MAHEFRLPDIGEGLTEAELVAWHVDVGDSVSADQVLCEVETDKSVVELPAPHAGTVLFLGAAEGDVIEVGDIVAVVGGAEEEWAPDQDAPKPSTGASADDAPASAPGAAPKAVPAVRKLAQERGVDLTLLTGTGPGGAVTRADVEAAAGGPVERRQLTKLRRTIAAHMERSWREIPHVTTFDDVDGTELLALRRSRSAILGVDVPIEALVVQAVLPALAAIPEFNATLDGDHLIVHPDRNIGIAVDTEDGLIVPVVKAADRLDLLELSQRILDLTSRTKARSVTPEELTGATFTISNIGAIGGGHGTPIIPIGTTAILSVGRAKDVVEIREGAATPVPRIPLSLSFDHRVIDGGLGRRFIDAVTSAIEQPSG